jgi:hypothetical protein
MTIFLAGLALIVFIGLALLAIVRAGIRRQERCRCLTCRPPDLAAALTRRLLRMEVQRPFPGACHNPQIHQPGRESLLVPDDNQLRRRR